MGLLVLDRRDHAEAGLESPVVEPVNPAGGGWQVGLTRDLRQHDVDIESMNYILIRLGR